MSRKVIISIILIGMLAIFYFTTGFFVIQPIGAIPDGVTVWYFRLGTNMPFISSPDSFCLKATGSVNLFGRGIAMTMFGKNFKDKILIKFPYTRTLYLLSTSGVEYDR
jgi:hypothetical protein